jgi:hypothetical protein
MIKRYPAICLVRAININVLAVKSLALAISCLTYFAKIVADFINAVAVLL